MKIIPKNFPNLLTNIKECDIITIEQIFICSCEADSERKV